jgi:hypothetical protein
MKGILSNEGDLYIKNNDFIITQDIEVLSNELYNFLNIRAAHIVNDVIIEEGECVEDQNLGLDHVILTESDTENIKSYISYQILRYFSERIKEIISISVEKDNKTRELSINFEARTIYTENIKMGVKI